VTGTGTGSTPWAAGLDARARLRLERFAREFDQVRASDFHHFAGPSTPDADLRAAMDAALDELHAESRRTATKEAVARFVQAAQHRYSERFGVAELLGLSAGAPATADDRVRVFSSLERAVAVVILWDQLDDETRIALAGPWASLVEAAVGTR
jgi:hypothetical protein